jgi:maltose alpha-D-glucosyltransferase/alpha-amylase
VEKLDEEERDDVLREVAPQAEMQIYGRGSRRRTAAMLGHDPRRMRLALSLLLSLPGTPVLLYGDEIGLDEDLSLPGRMSVRVPMRWSSGWNAGFSSAQPGRLVRPVRESPRRDTNVWHQQRNEQSLLNWTKRAVAARRRAGVGRGVAIAVESGDEAVFAHRCEGDAGEVVAVHNLRDGARDVRLDLTSDGAGVSELLADRRYEPASTGGLAFTIAPYGFRWLHLEPSVARDGEATGSLRRQEQASR